MHFGLTLKNASRWQSCQTMTRRDSFRSVTCPRQCVSISFCLLYKLQFTRPKLWWPTTKDIKLARGKQRHKNSKPLECILGIINAYLFSFSVFQMQFFFACQIKTNKFIARDATTNEIAKCQPELATKLAFAIYTPKISICTRRRLCCIEGNVSSRNVADECNEHSGICSGSVNPLHCHDIILMALAKFQVLDEH